MISAACICVNTTYPMSINVMYKSSVGAEMGDRLATIDMGAWAEKWGCCAPFRGEAGSPSNTMSSRLTSTFVPSGILIHPADWPQ